MRKLARQAAPVPGVAGAVLAAEWISRMLFVDYL